MRLARFARFPASALIALALSGCTGLSGLSGSSSYACKAPEGVTCESVSGTYTNAVQNNLPSQRRRTADTAPQQFNPPPPNKSASAPSTGTLGLAPTPVALRSMPRVLRLWFKPWEDADHDLYDQGYVYVRIDAGQWQIEHVQRQIRDANVPLKAPPRAVSGEGKDAALLPANPKGASRPAGEGTFPSLQSPTPTLPRGDTATE